jgi:hypothetical protein
VANIAREVLNAVGMSLPIFCGGMQRVGISLSGTWVGTVLFQVSYDGINWRPATAVPFASGTAVNSATANGSWFVEVGGAVQVGGVLGSGGFLAVRCQASVLTSGSVTVVLAAAQDSSWQDAYLGATSKYINNAATAATNTITVAAQTNRAWRCRTVWVTLSAAATWASSPAFQIQDGASAVLWAGDPPLAAGSFQVVLPADPNTPGVAGGGVVGTPGNQMVISLASGGGGVKTNLNVEMVAA